MKGIRYPFTLDKFGVVNSTTNLGEIYLDRLVTLLSTHIGQRPMAVTYGTDFSKALFENENQFGPAVKAAVTTAIKTWMTDVNLVSIEVGAIGDDGVAELHITIQLPDGELMDGTIKSSIFNINGTVQAGQ